MRIDVPSSATCRPWPTGPARSTSGRDSPTDPGPEWISDAAIRAIAEGRGAQYPPAHGLPQLREAICDHQATWYDVDWDPGTDVVVTTGASEAIVACVLAFVEPGDEVLVLEPWFDLYAAAIDLAGGVRVSVPPVPGTFRPDPAGILARITPRSRLLIVNSPHNPTGAVFTAEELAGISHAAVAGDVIVVSDEAYEHIWFEGNEHVPIATLPGMLDRTITVGSAGKSFSFTGWKVGWATGPAELIEPVRVIRQHLSYVSGGPFQWAVAEGLASVPSSYWTDVNLALAGHQRQLATGLESIGLRATPSEGTYFLLTDVTTIGFTSGAAFCDELPGRAGVVAIPVAPFCDSTVGEPWVRWAFCKHPDVIGEAVGRLQAAFG